MDESKMQAVLMDWVMEKKHHQMVLPNSRYFRWEADLLSVTNAWLVHEFEIKVSIYDYRADATNGYQKVRKHRLMADAFNGKSFGRLTPSYFWYVTNGFEAEDLPADAGWIRVYWAEATSWRPAGLRLKVEKSAPRLHTEKMADGDRLKMARWLSYKIKNTYRDTHLKRWQETREKEATHA